MNQNDYLRCREIISEKKPGDYLEVKEGYGIPPGYYRMAGTPEVLSPVEYPGGPRSDVLVPMYVDGRIERLHCIAIKLLPEK
jgi:hypothetical protein